MSEQTSEMPTARRHIIKRPRLTRLLDETTARIILLVAPAGYGKTTLAREWCETRSGTVWYQCTPASHDVAVARTEEIQNAKAMIVAQDYHPASDVRFGQVDPVAPAHHDAARDVRPPLLRVDCDPLRHDWPGYHRVAAWVAPAYYHQTLVVHYRPLLAGYDRQLHAVPGSHLVWAGSERHRVLGRSQNHPGFALCRYCD